MGKKAEAEGKVLDFLRLRPQEFFAPSVIATGSGVSYTRVSILLRTLHAQGKVRVGTGAYHKGRHTSTYAFKEGEVDASVHSGGREGHAEGQSGPTDAAG